MTRGMLPPDDLAPEEGGQGVPEDLVKSAAPDEDVPVTENRDRAALASEVELSPVSLVGSYFHRMENGEMVWAGVVVAEPQPGLYLCRCDRLDGRERGAQVLYPIADMVARDPGYEWRFYDTAEEQAEAFAEYVVTAARVEA